MRKIIIVLLSVAILTASQGAAFAAPKLALNPSSQMDNVGAIKSYREGAGAYDIARRANIYASANGISTGIFWSDKAHNIRREIDQANAFNPSSLIAIHSDGIPKSRGIFVLYSTPAGRNMGSIVGGYIAQKMKLKFEGLSYRPELLVLRHSKVPSILIEYLSHADLRDNQRLNDPYFRQQLAEATIEGYMNYVKMPIRSSRAKPVVKPVAKPVVASKPVNAGVAKQVAPVAAQVEKKATNNVMKINQEKPKKTVVKINTAVPDEPSPVQSGVGSKSGNGETEKAESGAVNRIVNLTFNYFKVSLGLGGVAQ